MKWLPSLALPLALLSALLLGTPAQAGEDVDASRDPTRWPPALRQALAPAASASAVPVGASRQVLLQDGRAYLLAQGRRYAVGQELDGARIERITEQAVWLREGGQLKREPLYGGVEKRAPAPLAAKKSKEKP